MTFVFIGVPILILVLVIAAILFPLLHILGWLVVGLVASAIAGLFIPEARKLEYWQSFVLGVGGSVIGGAITAAIGVDYGVLGSIGTAILILYLWVVVNRKSD